MIRVLMFSFYVALACGLSASEWEGWRGSVDGGSGDQTWHASVVQPDGTFVIAGDRQDPKTLPALAVHDLVEGSYGGSVMRIEPNTGIILSLTQVPGVVLAMDVTPDGDLLLASNTGSMGLSAHGETLQWKAGSSDEIASDGAGGAWFSTRKGKQVTHVDKTGKLLHSFKAGAGFGIHSMTYLVEQKLVVVGGAISRSGPIHVPYIHAHRHDGSMAWKMYDFPGKASVKAGDIADTLVVKMAVGPDGSLYAVAHSDGGATMWRHHPQKLGAKMPNVPVGHQGGQMYLAKRSNRILCLAKIDPKVGMPQKIAYITSWSHSKDKPNDKVASDQEAFGITISPSGKLAVAGVSRGHIPWTKNAVHKESFPIESIGRYNNPMAADEAFFIILDKELNKAEIFTGLGRSKEFPSQAKAIALTDDHVLVGGFVKSPAGTSVGQTAWTKNSWSTTSGGGKDALFSLFGGKESRIDGLPSKQLATYAKFALPQGESMPANLADALNDETSLAAKLVTLVGNQGITQAKGLADAGLIAESEAILADLIKRFANTPWGEQATAAQTDLQADPHYKLNKDISDDIADYYKAADRLREVRGAKVSALDIFYFKRNASTFRKMGKIAKDLQELPEGLGDGVAAKAQELIANARSYGIAFSKEEEKAFKSYHLCMGLTTRLKIKGKEKPLWSDKNFRKRNERVLVQMRAMLNEIIALDLDHPITQAAKDARDQYGLGGKK